MTKPGLPQGTRDFGAAVVRKRNFIFDTIRSVFELYGFQPLETPAMENLDTLMGKYGEEGDKLIFKILNNGLDNPAKQTQAKEDFEKILSGKSSKGITERALRYDLTIPFARYVAMNYGQLTMPFKRYQIQPVWRADRPQKGRYREFYQCDADVVGSRSLLNEVELAGIYSQVFTQLGIPVEIRINSRKILAALAEICGGTDNMTNITIAIDKLDKIGLEKVKEELTVRGLAASQVATIEKYLLIEGSGEARIAQLRNLLGDNATGAQGIAEIEYLLNYQPPTPNAKLETDFTLARGLNYYTGIIFEVKAMGVQMGSIGGGGRYDDLTGLFGVPDVPGVGISFGVDRIYDVMEELQLFPEEVQAGTQVLFFNLGETESRIAFGLMQQLRSNGIRCELFHENTKFDKQFRYADKKQIPYAVIIGSKEAEDETCLVKNLLGGQQKTLPQSQLAGFAFT
ncbi:MAG: histidine--tRNA ligase [Sediminibacterium sp.]|nr:histidine--tRNA ligase [Sediminibacterium sp.]